MVTLGAQGGGVCGGCAELPLPGPSLVWPLEPGRGGSPRRPWLRPSPVRHLQCAWHCPKHWTLIRVKRRIALPSGIVSSSSQMRQNLRLREVKSSVKGHTACGCLSQGSSPARPGLLHIIWPPRLPLAPSPQTWASFSHLAQSLPGPCSRHSRHAGLPSPLTWLSLRTRNSPLPAHPHPKSPSTGSSSSFYSLLKRHLPRPPHSLGPLGHQSWS